MSTTSNRCYFLNGERIAAVEAIACDDDAAPLLEADQILAASHYRPIEIWDGPRKVALSAEKTLRPKSGGLHQKPIAANAGQPSRGR